MKRRADSELRESISPNENGNDNSEDNNFKVGSDTGLNINKEDGEQKVTPILEQERFLPMCKELLL